MSAAPLPFTPALATISPSDLLTFAMLRVIGDSAATALPPALRGTLGSRLAGVLAALARDPAQLPMLLCLSNATRRAMVPLAEKRRRPAGG